MNTAYRLSIRSRKLDHRRRPSCAPRLLPPTEKLTLRQRTSSPEAGHAIECRINAEDPYSSSFARASPLVRTGGPGIRVDSHAHAGYFGAPSELRLHGWQNHCLRATASKFSPACASRFPKWWWKASKPTFRCTASLWTMPCLMPKAASIHYPWSSAWLGLLERRSGACRRPGTNDQ